MQKKLHIHKTSVTHVFSRVTHYVLYEHVTRCFHSYPHKAMPNKTEG